MLVQCRKYLRHKYQSMQTSPSSTSTPRSPSRTTTKMAASASPSCGCTTPAFPSRNAARTAVKMSLSSETIPPSPSTEPTEKPVKDATKHVRLFPEASVSIEVPNKELPGGKIVVSGRADWAMGYRSAARENILLVAMEAKQRSELSGGEAQLITYLAILREARRRMGKTNTVTQGFYTDGTRFVFVCITTDGFIKVSRLWDIGAAADLQMVYNWIIHMMETAMKSTPNASPTKPGPQRQREIDRFEDEVWSKVYKFVDASIMTSDSEMDGM